MGLKPTQGDGMDVWALKRGARCAHRGASQHPNVTTPHRAIAFARSTLESSVAWFEPLDLYGKDVHWFFF
jgi:hypothetical protein